MTKGGKLVEGIFEGETINTPSMLALEDYLDALKWAEGLGGLKALIARSNANLNVLARWVKECGWADFLAKDEAIRSTPACASRSSIRGSRRWLPTRKPRRPRRSPSCSTRKAWRSTSRPTAPAPPGLRIWCGATVDHADVEALTPWLDWAWEKVKNG